MAAPLMLSIAMIWLAHIGFDRALGYGLKYAGGFGFTHLGRIGKARLGRIRQPISTRLHGCSPTRTRSRARHSNKNARGNRC